MNSLEMIKDWNDRHRANKDALEDQALWDANLVAAARVRATSTIYALYDFSDAELATDLTAFFRARRR